MNDRNRPTTPTPLRINQFSDLPLPRLVLMRAQYDRLRATQPGMWAYATAAVSEIDALIAASASVSGVAA